MVFIPENVMSGEITSVVNMIGVETSENDTPELGVCEETGLWMLISARGGSVRDVPT